MLRGTRTRRGTIGPAIAAFAAACAFAHSARPAAPAPDGLIASPEPDWPQFRGPRRDGICDEAGLLDRWPEAGPPLLRRDGGLGRGWSSPVIVKGQIWITGDVGDELRIFAFDLAGRKTWETPNGRAWKGSYPGARACPAYSEGRLFHMNAHGRVACIEAATGAEVWAVVTFERFGATRIPWGHSENLLVDGDRVIVTPGGRKAVMAALDKRTGEVVWTTGPIGEDHASYASPILFRFGGIRQIASYSARHSFAVDADTGRLLWTRPMATRFDVLVAMPVYCDGSLFLTGPDGDDAELVRLFVEARAIRTERLWTSKLNVLTGGAIRLDGAIYGSGYRWNNGWFRVDGKTGGFAYEMRDLASGGVLAAEGLLYILSERGEAALLRPGADRFETLGRFPLVPGRPNDAWAHPVIHGGRLYLRHHESLWCFDIRRAPPARIVR